MESFFKNYKKEFFLGVGSLLGFYFISKVIKTKKTNNETIIQPHYTKLTKIQIIAYLKDFKSEIIGPIYDIIALREELTIIYQKNGEEVTNEFLRKKIFPNFISSLKKKEIFLMKKHSLKSRDLEGSIRDIFFKDIDVSSLKSEIDKMIEKGLNGVSPSLDLSSEILEFLTPIKCYDYTLEIMVKSIFRIRDLYIKLKNEGVIELKMTNSIVLARIQALNLKKLKEDILIEKKLGNFKDSPVEIFTKVLHRHQDESKDLKEKIERIERNYQKIMEIISEDPEKISSEEIKEFFFINIF